MVDSKEINKISNLEDSIESTVKSLSKKEDIICNFNDFESNFLNIDPKDFLSLKINLPKDLQRARGFGDFAALFIAYHNKQIHQNYQFFDNKKSKLFDDFEKARIVILGSKQYVGIGLNLKNIIESDIEQITEIWDLPWFLVKKSLFILSNIQVASFKQNVIDFIEDIQDLVDSQDLFSKRIFDFIEQINLDNNDPLLEFNLEQSKGPNIENDQSPSLSESEVKSEKEADKFEEESSLKEEQKDLVEDNQDFDSKEIAQSISAINDVFNNSNEIKFVNPYKIFTKKYDIIAKASDLATKEELEKLRNNLDLKLKNLEKISNKSKAKLKRKLLSNKLISNEYNKEEGLIDKKKLKSLIIDPIKKDNYMQVKDNKYQDVMISFLIDNSGSMRGNPITMSIMACEIIVQILEKFSIKTEILGFTTARWHGGKSKQLWQINGSAKNPGRLSDLLHIIYKNANQSFSQAKNNLVLMLKEGILKENIDGEALLWAAKRLSGYNYDRKILIVISDGAPIDDSTNSNNGSKILVDHLHHVISLIEKRSDIELAAIGIGHNVGEFYKNSLTIKNAEDLGDSLIEEICKLL